MNICNLIKEKNRIRVIRENFYAFKGNKLYVLIHNYDQGLAKAIKKFDKAFEIIKILIENIGSRLSKESFTILKRFI